jgi:hypothetical protein
MTNNKKTEGKTSTVCDGVTETQKVKTIGDRISEEVKTYKDLYKTLVEVGNKQPASCIAGEIAQNIFIWQQVAEELKQYFAQERAKLD